MERKTVYVIFTQGFNSNNFVATITRKVIQWFTKSKFDHVEFLMQGDTGYGLKCRNNLLPEHQAFLEPNTFYSSSFTTKGHVLITFKARLKQLQDQKYTGKIYITSFTADKKLFWEDQQRVVNASGKYTFVWAFVSALNNYLEKIGIDIVKVAKFFKIDLGKIYTKKEFCSAFVSIGFQASAVDNDGNRLYNNIDKEKALLSSPADIWEEVRQKTKNSIELTMEFKNGFTVYENKNLII